MRNNVQTADLETGEKSQTQLLKGIDHECSAPLSLMTFFEPTDVRLVPPKEEPVDDINRRFYLGETIKLLGKYQIGIARFLTTRPPELAEAVFTFKLQEPDAPDIIRLRATDHIGSREKNIVASFYLVWQIEVFPKAKDYENTVLKDLITELIELASSGVTQNALLAIISRITNFKRRLK